VTKRSKTARKEVNLPFTKSLSKKHWFTIVCHLAITEIFDIKRYKHRRKGCLSEQIERHVNARLHSCKINIFNALCSTYLNDFKVIKEIQKDIFSVKKRWRPRPAHFLADFSWSPLEPVPLFEEDAMLRNFTDNGHGKWKHFNWRLGNKTKKFQVTSPGSAVFYCSLARKFTFLFIFWVFYIERLVST